jgi:hypothetical protein
MNLNLLKSIARVAVFAVAIVLLSLLAMCKPTLFFMGLLVIATFAGKWRLSARLGVYPNAAGTNIASLWTPDIWIRGLNEKMNTMPSLISSNIVKRTPEFDALAAGGGVTANVPYFRDITDQADNVQAEGVQPQLQALGSGKQIAPMMNRESGLGATALAAVVIGAGETPVEGITSQLAVRRQKQRQVTLLSICRGIFGFNSAPGGAGALAAVRNDVFLEAGANPAANQLINPFVFADTIAKLGELADTTLGGGIAMHPIIRAALIKQDQISFTHYSLQSGTVLTGPAPKPGEAVVEYYKGYRVFVSNLLFRAGAQNGYVFDTYVFAPGVFAWGEKPQVDGTQIVDVASLSYFNDNRINQSEIYDRSRFLLHPNGLRWTGQAGIAGQSPANSELINAANWTLDYTTADRVGIVSLRTNG